MMPEHVQSQTVLACWLLPAPPARDFFRRIVARLARECAASLFEPHLTIAVGPDALEQAQRTLARVVVRPIELQAAGIHYTSKFTKTLFVRFHSSPELERLRHSLGGARAADDSFDPHVSLLYQNISGEEQTRLARTIDLPFQSVSFDTLQIVRCRNPVTTSADIATWEVLPGLRKACSQATV